MSITEGRQDGGLDQGNGHGTREAESEGLGDWTGLGPGLDVSSRDGTSISKKLGFNSESQVSPGPMHTCGASVFP